MTTIQLIHDIYEILVNYLLIKQKVILVGVVKSSDHCGRYVEEGCIQNNNTYDEISSSRSTYLKSSYINLYMPKAFFSPKTIIFNAKSQNEK